MLRTVIGRCAESVRICYLKGVGVAADCGRAVEWFLNAAARSDTVEVCYLCSVWPPLPDVAAGTLSTPFHPPAASAKGVLAWSLARSLNVFCVWTDGQPCWVYEHLLCGPVDPSHTSITSQVSVAAGSRSHHHPNVGETPWAVAKNRNNHKIMSMMEEEFNITS